MFDRLVYSLRTRSHNHDYPFGLFVACIVEQSVTTARSLCEAGHQTFDDAGAGVVKDVRGLAGLKEDVGVLSRTAQHRSVGRERTPAVRSDQTSVDHEALFDQESTLLDDAHHQLERR